MKSEIRNSERIHCVVAPENDATEEFSKIIVELVQQYSLKH
jgi:hypothetical protein